MPDSSLERISHVYMPYVHSMLTLYLQLDTVHAQLPAIRESIWVYRNAMHHPHNL